MVILNLQLLGLLYLWRRKKLSDFQLSLAIEATKELINNAVSALKEGTMQLRLFCIGYRH